jgi:hypothetical protein
VEAQQAHIGKRCTRKWPGDGKWHIACVKKLRGTGLNAGKHEIQFEPDYKTCECVWVDEEISAGRLKFIH